MKSAKYSALATGPSNEIARAGLAMSGASQPAGNGTGIDAMKDAARELIFGQAPQHRTAVVEFHDNQPGDNFSTLVNFTTSRPTAWAAVRDHAPFHGFSSAWDAVESGLQLFPATPDPSRVRVLAFLSDGFDNSSTATPQTLIDEALAALASFPG